MSRTSTNSAPASRAMRSISSATARQTPPRSARLAAIAQPSPETTPHSRIRAFMKAGFQDRNAASASFGTSFSIDARSRRIAKQ